MVFEFVSSHLSRVAVCVPRSGSYEMSWAAELELRRPYVGKRSPFASVAQQQSCPLGDPLSARLRALVGEGVASY